MKYPAEQESKTPAQMNNLVETKAPTLENDYVLEDESIVEDLVKDEKKDDQKHEVPEVLVEQMKTWTPAPVIEEQLSKEELYKLEAAAEPANLQMALNQLLEFGFTNFVRNKELLEKFNMNVEAVAGALLEDAEE